MDYGFVDKAPKDLKKGDFYMLKHYDVSRTGTKQQFYTLYCEYTVCLFGYWHKHCYTYEKNLSFDKDRALKEAKKISNSKQINFYETPKPEVNNFKAFNLKWKEGKKAFYAVPDHDFWKLWKKSKAEIKEVGFWVSKGDNSFMVFFKKEKNH